MSLKLGSNADAQQNSWLNLVIHNLSGAPSSPKPGQKYYSTATGICYTYSGVSSSWRPDDAAALTDGSVPIAALAVDPRARGTHTGTQLASTISNLAGTVQGYTLDSFAVPAGTVNFGAQRLTGLANASAATDAVPLAQVNSIVAAAVAGQTAIKNPARLCATGNLSLSGLSAVDGVTPAAGDRVLAPFQSTTSQIGLYVAASGAWSLASDGNAAAQWTEGTEILVAEGTTYGGAIFRQTTANPTITTLAFVQAAKTVTYQGDGATIAVTGTTISAILGNGLKSSGTATIVDPAVVERHYNGTITHDGSTTSFQLTHGLGTAALHITVRDSSGNQWLIDNTTTTTTATMVWSTAQANGTVFTVHISG